MALTKSIYDPQTDLLFSILFGVKRGTNSWYFRMLVRIITAHTTHVPVIARSRATVSLWIALYVWCVPIAQCTTYQPQAENLPRNFQSHVHHIGSSVNFPHDFEVMSFIYRKRHPSRNNRFEHFYDRTVVRRHNTETGQFDNFVVKTGNLIDASRIDDDEKNNEWTFVGVESRHWTIDVVVYNSSLNGDCEFSASEVQKRVSETTRWRTNKSLDARVGRRCNKLRWHSRRSFSLHSTTTRIVDEQRRWPHSIEIYKMHFTGQWNQKNSFKSATNR